MVCTNITIMGTGELGPIIQFVAVATLYITCVVVRRCDTVPYTCIQQYATSGTVAITVALKTRVKVSFLGRPNNLTNLEFTSLVSATKKYFFKGIEGCAVIAGTRRCGLHPSSPLNNGYFVLWPSKRRATISTTLCLQS